MKNKGMYKKIQQLKRQGYCKLKISAKLALDTKTVAKYYNMNLEEYQKMLLDVSFRDKIFDEYKVDILELYKKNEYQKQNIASVYDYLEEKHGMLAGNEKTLRNYINYLLTIGLLEYNNKIRIYEQVPELPYGRQMQLDFGEYKIGQVKLYIYAAVLSASRFKYYALTDRPFTTLAVIKHTLDCFDYFGGMPQEIVIDQDKVLVVSENKGDIIHTKDWTYFSQEMCFSHYVCRKADPESKGKVENIIKYIKYNYLDIRNFQTLEEVKYGLPDWTRRRANGKISQATKRRPADLIILERESLQAVKNSIFRKDDPLYYEERNVNNKAQISAGASLYTVPPVYRNKSVEMYQTHSKLYIFDPLTNKEIASHNISLLPGAVVTDRHHLREKEKAIDEIKENNIKMFSEMEEWKKFAQLNHKKYSRFTRDQCLEAKKHFSKQIDHQILKIALDFCLQADTLSYANLKDTYNYYLNEQKQCDLEKPVKTSVFSPAKAHPLLEVKVRSIENYKYYQN